MHKSDLQAHRETLPRLQSTIRHRHITWSKDGILLRRFCTTITDIACNPSLQEEEKKAMCSKNTSCSSV